MAEQGVAHPHSDAFDVARILADQQRREDRGDEVRRRNLIFAAPARSTRNLSETGEVLIGVNLDEQKRRDGMRSTFRSDGEVFMNRNPNRNGFDGANLHGYQVRKSSTNAVTSRTMASKNRCPFPAVARSGCPTTPLSEISWNSFTA